MERNDLVIAGAGHASGGLYNIVKVSGTGKLFGDIDCRDFNIQGNATIEGNVKAETAHISGRLHTKGALHADEIKISGSVAVGGNIECKVVRFHGHGNVKGAVNAEEIYIHGETNIAEGCAAEVFDARGIFTVGGLLNAGSVRVKLYGYCQANEIGGDSIEVKQAGVPFLKKLFSRIGLKAGTIEGDEIYLEHTSAKMVRGNKVTIGPGCVIEQVEYQHHFHCAEGAKVGSSQKIGGGQA